jgi:hypothetical protein
MRPGCHEADPKDLRGDELANVAGRGWPSDQGSDLALDLILVPNQSGEASNFV